MALFFSMAPCVSGFAQVDESDCSPARWSRIWSNSFPEAEVNSVTLCSTNSGKVDVHVRAEQMHPWKPFPAWWNLLLCWWDFCDLDCLCLWFQFFASVLMLSQKLYSIQVNTEKCTLHHSVKSDVLLLARGALKQKLVWSTSRWRRWIRDDM